jgi:hypothetical protein
MILLLIPILYDLLYQWIKVELLRLSPVLDNKMNEQQQQQQQQHTRNVLRVDDDARTMRLATSRTVREVDYKRRSCCSDAQRMIARGMIG